MVRVDFSAWSNLGKENSSGQYRRSRSVLTCRRWLVGGTPRVQLERFLGGESRSMVEPYLLTRISDSLLY